MKTLKRLSVLFVALAMIFNLVAVSAEYTSSNQLNATIKLIDSKGNEIQDDASLKGGSTVTVEVYFEEGDFGANFMVTAVLDSNITLPEASAITQYVSETEATVTKRKASVDHGMGITSLLPVSITEGQKIFSFDVVLPTGEYNDMIVAYVPNSKITATLGGLGVTLEKLADSNKTKVNIVPVWPIKDWTPVVTDGDSTFEVPFATAENSIGLPSKVEVWSDTTKNTESGSKKANIAVTDWTCVEEGGYKANVPGNYTFEGTLAPTADDVAVTTGEGAITKVTAEVTVNKDVAATEHVKTEYKDVQLRKLEEGGTKSAAELAQALADEYKTVKLTNEAGDKTYNVTWTQKEGETNSLNMANVTAEEGNSTNVVNLVGKIAIPANDAIYAENASFVVGEIAVTVIPATIVGSTIEMTNKNVYTVPEFNVTMPEAEVLKAFTAETDNNGTPDDPTDDKTVYTGTTSMKVKLTPVENGTAGATKELEMTGITYDDFVFENGVAKLVFKDNTATNKDKTYSQLLSNATNAALMVSAEFNMAALADEENNELGVPVQEKDENGTPVTDKDGNPVMTYPTEDVSKPISGNAPGIPTGGSKPGTDTPNTPVTPVDPVEPTEPTEPTEPAEAPFADVPADYWAVEFITALKDAGVIGGVTATEFAPEADITRAEFTKMIVGVLGLEAASTESAFVDCPADAWFTPYVVAAVEAGLVNGVTETEFAPNETITREQAMAIIGRAIAKDATAGELVFTDAEDIDEYALPYVAVLTQMGVVNGYPDGTVRPDANITRAEAAKMLAGLMPEEEAPADDAAEGEEAPAEDADVAEEAPADEAEATEEAPAEDAEAAEGEEAPAEDAEAAEEATEEATDAPAEDEATEEK